MQLAAGLCLYSTIKKYVLTVQLEYFAGSLSGSDPDYSMGQWVIRISDVDPVAMLAVVASKFQLAVSITTANSN